MSERLSKSEIQHLTNYWCRTKGIHSRDLTDHPQVNDLVLLITIRDNLWQDMSATEQGVWSAYWGWTYTKAHSLKSKHLAKLENITKSVIFRQSQKQLAREKIRQLRESK